MVEDLVVIEDGKIKTNSDLLNSKSWNFKLHKKDQYIEVFEDSDGYQFPIENENTATLFRKCLGRLETKVTLSVLMADEKISLY